MRNFIFKSPVPDNLPKAGKIHHTGTAKLENTVVPYYPPFLQKINHPAAITFFNLYAHYPSRFPFIKFPFYLFQEISIHIVTFFQCKIPVPGYPEKIYGFNMHISKKGKDVFPDDFLNG